MRVEMQIVMSAATLLGLDDEPALLRGYGAIPASVAREIADAADHTALRGLFCDPVDGRLVAMEAATRCYVGPLRQFAVFRDQRCRLSDGAIVDVDHIKEARYGGPTTAGNGQGLGKNPHVIRDHPGVSVHADEQQPLGDGLDGLRRHAPTVTWTMPTGHAYPLRPPPVLDWGSRPARQTPPRPAPPELIRLPALSAPPTPEQLKRAVQRRISATRQGDLRRPHRQALRLERAEARIDRAMQRYERDQRRKEARASAQRRRQRQWPGRV